MAFSAFDRLRKGAIAAVGQSSDPDKSIDSASGTPTHLGLASAPQPTKILQDVLDCIESLKGGFEEDGTPIDDNNQTLHRFCAKLEFLLQADMKEKKTITGKKKEYWEYFCDCLAPLKGVNDGIKYVKTTGDCKTSLGKGRAFLRFCLMHHRLADSLQACCTNGKITSGWYFPKSLWLQHDKSCMIVSALYDLNDLIFDLAPRGYDLDNSWPSFSRKTNDVMQSWALSERARTMSISSLNSVDQSSIQGQLSSTPIDNSQADQLLAQELAISENLRTDLEDKIEALEQQKVIYQQTVAESRGEVNMLEAQFREVQLELKELRETHRALEKRYDKMCMETEVKDRDNQSKTSMLETRLSDLQTQNQSLLTRIQQADEDHTLVHENLNITATERDSVKDEVEEFRRRVAELEAEIAGMEGETRKELDKKSAENKTLIDQLQHKEETVSKHEQDTSVLQDKLREQHNLVVNLERKLSALTTGYQWLNTLKDGAEFKEISDLDATSTLTLKDVSHFVLGLEDKITASNTDRTKLEEEIKALTGTNTNLQHQVTASQEKLNTVQSFMNKLEQNEECLKQKVANLEETLNNSNEKLNQVKLEEGLKNKSVEELKVTIFSFKQENENLVKSIDERTAEVQEMKSKCEQTELELKKKMEEFNKLSKDNSVTVERLKNQAMLVEEQGNKITEYIGSLQSIEKQNKMLVYSKETLETAVREKEELLATSTNEMGKQKELTETVTSELNRIKLVKESIEKDLDHVKDKLTESENRLSHTSNHLEKEKERNETLLGKIEDLNNEMKRNQESLVKDKDVIVEQLQTAQNLNSQNERELALLMEKLANSEGAILKLTDTENKLSHKLIQAEKEGSGKSLTIVSLEKDVDIKAKEVENIKTGNEHLKAEVKQIQDQFYDKQSEVLLLNEKVERGQEELERTKQFYEAAAKTESDLSGRFKTLENNLSEKDRRITALTEIEKSLSVQNSKLQRDKDDLEKSLQKLESDMEYLKKGYSEKESQVENLKVSLSGLNIEKEGLQRKLNDLETLITEKESEICRLQVIIEESYGELSSIEQELKKRKSEESKTAKENRQFEQKIFEMERTQTSLNKTIEQMQIEFDDSVKERDLLEDKVSKLELKSKENKTEINNLSSECGRILNEKEEFQKVIDQKENRIKDEQDKLERLQVEFEVVTKDKYDLEEKNDTLETEIQQNKISISNLTQSLEKVRQELKSVNNKATGFEELIKELETEKISLENKLGEMETNKTQLNSQLDKVERKECDLIQQKNGLQESLENVSKHLRDKTVELETLNKSLLETMNLNEKLDSEKCESEKNCQKLADDILVLQEKESNNVDAIKKVEECVQKSELEKENVQGLLSLKCVEINELQARFDDFQSENACLVQEYDLLQQTFNDLKETEEVVRSKLSEMTSCRDELSDKANIVQEQLKETKQKLKTVLNEKGCVTEERDQIKKDMDKLNTNLEILTDEKAKIEKCYDEICTEKEKLEVQLYDARADIDKKQDEIETLDSQMKNVQTVVQDRDGDIEKLETKLNEAHVKANGLENAMKQLHGDIDAKNNSIEQYRNTIAERDQNCDKVNMELSDMKQQIDKLYEALNSSEKLYSEAQNTISEKIYQVEMMEQAKNEMEATMVELERDKEQLLYDLKSEKQHIDALQNKNIGDDSIIVELRNNIDALKEQSRTEIKRLEQDIQDLLSKENRLLEQTNKLSEEKEDLSVDIEALKDEVSEKKKSNLKTKNQLDEMTSVKNLLEHDYSEMRNELTTLKTKLHEAEAEKSKLETSFETTNREFEEKTVLLQTNYDNVVKDLQITQELQQQTSIRLDSIVKENNSLDVERQEVELKNEKIKKNLDDLNVKLESEQDSSKEKVAALKEEITELKELSESGMVERDNVIVQLKNYNFELTEAEKVVKEKLHQTQEIFRSEKEQLGIEMKRLKELLEEKDIVSSDLQNNLEENKQELQSLSEKNQCIENELLEKKELLQNSLDQRKDEYIEMQKIREIVTKYELKENEIVQELSDFKESFGKIEMERDVLKVTIDSMKNELEEKKGELQAVEECLQDKESNLEKIGSESERRALDSEAELDSLRQEVTALEFQLSSNQLEYEQNKQSNMNETEFSEMKDRVMEQETIIEQLQQEMIGLKEMAVKYKQQETLVAQLRNNVECVTSENAALNNQVGELTENLEKTMSSSLKVKNSFDDEKGKASELLQQKERENDELKADMHEMKKKLVKLIREKDTLWQKTDNLTFQQKLQASEKWVDDGQVTHCLGCSAEFSFTLRKHHCRLCGRIFCHNCSSHWVYTASSSKKSRACSSCFKRCNEVLEEDPNKLVNSELEQSIDVPKPKVLGLASPPSDINLSMASSTASLDSESGASVPTKSGASRKLVYDTSSTSSLDLINQRTPAENSANQLAAGGETGGNETDEDKLKDSAGTKKSVTEAGGDSGEDRFHVVSVEEIQRSISMSGDHETESSVDPNMSSSRSISLEELERGEVNSQNEVWIKAGKSFAVPVLISKPNTVFGWEFTSYPKDVVFSVIYRERQSMAISEGQQLVPPCKCDSHKQATKGELSAKQLGVYTLVFDNTYSKLTSKRVNYTLLSSPSQED